MRPKIQPKVREGLLTSDHSKRGRRFVTILNPAEAHVVLLEPWEHAILVLCDGTRTLFEIGEVLEEGVEGEPVTHGGIERTLEMFEHHQLIEPMHRGESKARKTASPRTIAGLQQAYREWHKDPSKTGQILAGVLPAPFLEPPGVMPVGLSPTVALPEEEEAAPVAVGTTLVLGSSTDSFEDQGLRSVLEGAVPSAQPMSLPSPIEPQTQIGSLTEHDEDHDEGIVEELDELDEDAHLEPSTPLDEDLDDELELVENVAQLLEGLDDDFAEADELDEPAKPATRVIAGETEVPRAKSIAKPATNIITDSDLMEAERELMEISKPRAHPSGGKSGGRKPAASPNAPTQVHKAAPERVDARDEPTMRAITLSEATLNPTMVGVPAGDELEPKFLAPPRTASDIGPGAIIEDTLPFGGPDETLGAFHPSSVQVTPPLPRGKPNAVLHFAEEEPSWTDETEAGVRAMTPKPDKEETTSTSSEHIAPGKVRAVFERLRKAGLKARAYGDEPQEPEDSQEERRNHTPESREFQEALESLTAGDLDVALFHFSRLLERMPDSERLKRFVREIKAAKAEEPTGPSKRADVLDDFEGVIKEAIADGHCPSCLDEVHAQETVCGACGFELKGALRRPSTNRAS